MEILAFYRIIPTYDNGTWTETEFTDLQDFRDFVKSTFKEPGKYDLDETSELFNKQARLFKAQGSEARFAYAGDGGIAAPRRLARASKHRIAARNGVWPERIWRRHICCRHVADLFFRSVGQGSALRGGRSSGTGGRTRR